jgi:hypothetical protein
MGRAARVVWWRLQVLGGRRRGRGAVAKGRTREGVAVKPKEGGGGRLGFWGGKSGLPSIGSRSIAQIRSHVCAPDPNIQVKQNSTVLLMYAS